MSFTEPRWLDKLEKKIGWIALPNLALFLSAVQFIGFLAALFNYEAIAVVNLNPEKVLSGEFWRMLTFLAVPMDTRPLFMVIEVFFLYFAINTLEHQWGEFKTTFYLLISIIITDIFALITGIDVGNFVFIEMSVIFAVATLYPDYEIMFEMIIPMKMKYLGLFSALYMIYLFFLSDAIMRYYMVLVFSNYFLFFGGYGFKFLQQKYRRWNYKRKFKE